MSGKVQGRSRTAQKLRVLIFCVTGVFYPGQFPVAQSAAQPATQSRKGAVAFSLLDLAGKTHTERDYSHAKAAVFFFVAAECPISNRYSPEVNSIVAQYSQENIAFYAVHSEPDIERQTAIRHAADYGYRFPVLLDRRQVLASQFGVMMTPTVVVVSTAGEVLYRGRIDNRYIDFGRFRNVGITPDLRNALDSVVQGKRVEVPLTKTVGCAIPEPPVG